jgi:BirA family biotin operon repressor/biotin-[acetyl-CoA-carboxylase] ligase
VIQFLDAVPNTMDAAADLARAGACHGSTVATTTQQFGRGRRGNVWQCPAGASLCMTTLLRVPADPFVSIRAGVAVQSALPVETWIKWPNDIWARDKKLAGVIIEATADVLLVGTGVNLRPAGAPGISLEEVGATVDAEALARSVVDALLAWLDEPVAAVQAAWARRDGLLGHWVRADAANGPVTGVCGGIDSAGRLRVGEAWVSAGEVHRVRIA